MEFFLIGNCHECGANSAAYIGKENRCMKLPVQALNPPYPNWNGLDHSDVTEACIYGRGDDGYRAVAWQWQNPLLEFCIRCFSEERWQDTINHIAPAEPALATPPATLEMIQFLREAPRRLDFNRWYRKTPRWEFLKRHTDALWVWSLEDGTQQIGITGDDPWDVILRVLREQDQVREPRYSREGYSHEALNPLPHWWYKQGDPNRQPPEDVVAQWRGRYIPIPQEYTRLGQERPHSFYDEAIFSPEWRRLRSVSGQYDTTQDDV